MQGSSTAIILVHDHIVIGRKGHVSFRNLQLI
jgi:DNA repair protein RadC